MPAQKRERSNDNVAPPQPSNPASTTKAWRKYYPSVDGPIDVPKYDMPQGKCSLEWWYYNCHLEADNDASRTFSLFSSFFRQADITSLDEDEIKKGDKDYEFYTAALWAVSDVKNQKYYADSLLDHRAPEHIVNKLDPKVTGKKTVHAETALLELVKKGKVPLPDRLMKKKATVKTAGTELNLNLDDECIVVSRPATAADKVPANACQIVYDVTLTNPNKQTSAKLTFIPERDIVRHGTTGVVNDMFYYYIPRMRVQGTMTIKDEVIPVHGSGWYDREFGGKTDDTGKDALDAWTWFSCQLDDETEFSFFNIVDRDSLNEKENVAIFTDKQGKRTELRDVVLSYSDMWTSLNTYIAYPQCWKLAAPSIGLELYLDCEIPHQEFVTVLVTGGGFYEGRVRANGSHNGKQVKGVGFLERKNHVTYKDTAGLLKNVGVFVKNTLSEMYPKKASQKWIDTNVLGRNAYAPDSSAGRVCDTIFSPIRSLIDRGGKSWRSLIMVSSINALSEDYYDCSKYIAISELLHVGSLVIDDIQDESSVRRGGKTVHLAYGTPTAINAGTACYFMAPLLAGVDGLAVEKKAEVYDLYFDVLRAGHAGQGLDIAGLDSMMPQAVETGDVNQIQEALKAIHIYKTGGAAGSLCAMACVIRRAPPKAAYALETFGTQIGLAFQIVDDALNLRGFEGDLKEVGEDIKDGKVTYPVIKAMARLDKSDRQYVWAILQEKTSDQGKISSVIAKLNSVSAIDDCLVEARNIVEDSWALVEEALPDSIHKLVMRTFCNYLTERTF